MRFENQVVIVTGAARGIGAALALAFAQEGAKVVVADIMEAAATVLAITKAGGEAMQVAVDVSEEAQCMAMAKAAVERFGQIDVLINNAAISNGIAAKPFYEISSQEFKRILMTNATAPFHCIKAVFPYMKGRGGSIVNMASASILEGLPRMSHYVASKGAVVALTRSLARELGEFEIRVNSIAPGFIDTAERPGEESGVAREISFVDRLQMPFRCLKRCATPGDVVGLALFLASSESSFITGQMIVDDGGLNLH